MDYAALCSVYPGGHIVRMDRGRNDELYNDSGHSAFLRNFRLDHLVLLFCSEREKMPSVVTSYWRGKDFCQELTKELQKNGFDFGAMEDPNCGGRLTTVHFFGGMERVGRKQAAITVVLLEGIENLEDCMAIEMSLQELRQRWYKKGSRGRRCRRILYVSSRTVWNRGLSIFVPILKISLSLSFLYHGGYEKDTRRLFYARGENFVTEGFAKASSCIENYFVYQDSIHVVPQEKEKT